MHFRFFPFLLALGAATGMLQAARPKLTVVVVVDQLSEHVLSNHRHFLTGGLHTLLEKGFYFSHAYHPHSQPETATGHAMISTGAYASQHGLVANEWVLASGEHINACDDLSSEATKVFSPTDKTGKSARALLSPTIASSCIQAQKPYEVIALSLKSRAAIPLTGSHGKPFWFDTKGARFTSSTAFMKQLPGWIEAMNRHLEKTIVAQKKTSWTPCFPPQSREYEQVDPDTYAYSGYPFSLIEKPTAFVNEKTGAPYYHPFEQTPQASLELFRLGQLAIQDHFEKHPKKPLLLFISLSNFDYVGHYYGPYSKEVIDTLYHIDKQLDFFMKSVEKKYGASGCLWALTADHGITEIPELLHKEGNPHAQRVSATKIVKDLNQILYDTFNIKNAIKTAIAPHLYMDNDKWVFRTKEEETAAVEAVKSYLKLVPGIANAWHHSDLAHPDFLKTRPHNDRTRWYGLQYMPGRSGDFIVQVKPFVQFSSYPKGTCHDSPYDPDIRVPVIFYGPGLGIKSGTYEPRTSMRHFASTLAYLLGVPAPAHAPKNHWGGLIRG